jgi:long-subunit fatty acid transport protein
MRWNGIAEIVCGLSIGLFGAMPACAQTNADINSGLQFSFIPPGARSLAMGGAFTGMAADATAAWTNPAGLVVLTKPEASLEIRGSEYENEFPSGGSISSPGIGKESSSTTGVAFASAVLPVRNSRWSLAIFYHELANFAAAIDSREMTRPGERPENDRFGSLDLRIPGLGGAAALRLSDQWALGMSVVAYSLKMESETTGAPNPGSPEGATESQQVASGDDQALGGTIGVQWSNGKWTLGGVYRMAPRFDTDYAFVCGNRTAETGGSTRCSGFPEGSAIPELSGTSRFKAPDSFGVGVALQATERLVVAVDVIQVRYSQLAEEIGLITTQGQSADFYIDDGTELRLGVEYYVPLEKGRGLHVRAGAWRDPDHRLHYSGEVPSLDTRFNTIAGDQTHAAIGLGISAGARVTVDLAADFADSVDTFALSTVVRF